MATLVTPHFVLERTYRANRSPFLTRQPVYMGVAYVLTLGHDCIPMMQREQDGQMVTWFGTSDRNLMRNVMGALDLLCDHQRRHERLSRMHGPIAVASRILDGAHVLRLPSFQRDVASLFPERSRLTHLSTFSEACGLRPRTRSIRGHGSVLAIPFPTPEEVVEAHDSGELDWYLTPDLSFRVCQSARDAIAGNRPRPARAESISFDRYARRYYGMDPDELEGWFMDDGDREQADMALAHMDALGWEPPEY